MRGDSENYIFNFVAEMNTSKDIRYYACSILCLLAGAMLYVLFRETVIFTLPFEHFASSWPQVELPDNIATRVLRFYLPDVFWCLSLLIYASTIDVKSVRLVALSLPTICECMQAFPSVPGTFDFIDLSIYLIITLLFVYGKENM